MIDIKNNIVFPSVSVKVMHENENFVLKNDQSHPISCPYFPLNNSMKTTIFVPTLKQLKHGTNNIKILDQARFVPNFLRNS